MATNFIQKGRILTVAAPYDRTSGQGAMIGSIFGVALATVLSGANGDFDTEGVWTLTKTAAQAWTLGDKIYWNAGTKLCSNVSTDGPLIGVAVAAAANPSSTGTVRLNGSAASALEGPQEAIVSITDNTGDAGTHDDTVADGVTVDAALVDNGGGAAPDGTIAVITSVANAGSADVAPVADAVKELSARCNTLRTDSLTHNQNVADLAEKVNEILAVLRTVGIIVP